jgi:hypothetical protein
MREAVNPHCAPPCQAGLMRASYAALRRRQVRRRPDGLILMSGRPPSSSRRSRTHARRPTADRRASRKTNRCPGSGRTSPRRSFLLSHDQASPLVFAELEFRDGGGLVIGRVDDAEEMRARPHERHMPGRGLSAVARRSGLGTRLRLR